MLCYGQREVLVTKFAWQVVTKTSLLINLTMKCTTKTIRKRKSNKIK
jgi:hypothetical protein